MLILQVASGDFFSTYGGGQVYVKNIVDEFLSQHIETVILSFVDGIHDVVSERYHNAHLYKVPSFLSKGELSAVIREIAPDLMHVHSHKAMLCEIGHSLGIPVIVTAHHGGILCPVGTLMNDSDEICHTTHSVSHCLKCCLSGIRNGLFWYPLMKFLPENTYKKWGSWLSHKPFVPFVSPIGGAAWSISCKQQDWNKICQFADKVVAPSIAIAEAMQRNGLLPTKITILPHGIPLPDHAPAVTTQKGGIKFFFVGRICYVKGLHILLEAFSRLSDPVAELHLIGGAGNKQERRYLEGLKRRYQSDERIVWHGKIEPNLIFETIKKFHIMIHATICMEIYGLNIAEALAMGKPVLATRCGGAEMQIEEGVNGWLVAPNDVDALYQRMRDLVEHRVHIPLHDVGSKVISIQEHCQSLLKLYEETIDRC